MSRMDTGSFYIGWQERAPRGTARWLAPWLATVVVIALAVAVYLPLGMRTVSDAHFEFGTETELSGQISLAPVPCLLVPRPGTPVPARFLLVAPFKHGADELVSSAQGQWVTLKGTLIYRDGTTMVEVVPGSLRIDEEQRDTLRTAAIQAGEVTLEGEIVDSKCFLGVMKPGELKTHRACASLCIRGGIPPILCVRDSAGLATYYVLVGQDGTSIGTAVLPYVAEPVRLHGALERHGDLAVLRMDPSTIERL